MIFTLMHKNIAVAKLNITESDGVIENIEQLITPEHLPLSAKYNTDTKAGLHNWMQYRSVPKTRKGLRAILEQAGVETTNALSLKSLGLNLSDQYWFCPIGNDLTWEDVNLFQNQFEKQPFSTTSHTSGSVSSFSPDYSSNGELRKYWRIHEGKRYLYKEGAEPYFQEPHNEVFASRLLDILEINHAKYHCEVIADIAYSVCETFCTPDTEYIPASNILSVCKKNNNENNYQHFWRCVYALHIPCHKQDIDNMIAFDYLIQNRDRHWGNFGFIRDSNTLKFRKMAPLFDHGNSLWHKSLWQDMVFRHQEAKPFRDEQEEQIKLIDDISLPLEKINQESIVTIAQECFEQNPRMDSPRINRIIERVTAASNYLQSLFPREKELDISRS